MRGTEEGEEQEMMVVVVRPPPQSCVQPCLGSWVDVSAPCAHGGLAPGSLGGTWTVVPKTKCILVT